MTFSIVGRDPRTGELGIAVQSKFLAVGAVVPWAKAGVGAIATQAWANTSYGPRGLELLASGLSAAETIAQLTNEDEGRASRQVGIVAANHEGKALEKGEGLGLGLHFMFGVGDDVSDLKAVGIGFRNGRASSDEEGVIGGRGHDRREGRA